MLVSEVAQVACEDHRLLSLGKTGERIEWGLRVKNDRERKFRSRSLLLHSDICVDILLHILTFANRASLNCGRGYLLIVYGEGTDTVGLPIYLTPFVSA